MAKQIPSLPLAPFLADVVQVMVGVFPCCLFPKQAAG
jgi:hypothetical protein